MKSSIYLITLSLSLVVLSCRSTGDVSATSMKITFELMESGILSGGGEEGIEESLVICNTQAEWEAIKSQMNRVNYTTSRLDEMEVDFNKSTVIGYFQPVRGSGGYALSADSLIEMEKDGGVNFTVYYSLSKPQGAATTMLTQPYAFIQTRKLNGPVDYAVSEL